MYEAAFANALDAAVITDDGGVYVDVNDSACALFGLGRDELLGRSLYEFIRVADFGDSWGRFMAQGSMTGELDLLRADGAIRRVEYAARAAVVPGRHLAIIRDVTERRREQQVREEERDLLAQMQEVASIGGWTWDTEKDLAVWSDECHRIAGVEPGSVTDLAGYLRLVHPDDRDVVVGAAHETLRSNRPFEAEHRILRPDGETRWVLVCGRQQRGLDGRPTRKLVGVAQDLTDAKRAQEDVRRVEEQLRLAQKLEAVAVLAGGIAHDFNNILSVILGFTSLALEDPALSPEALESLGEVKGATERAVALTRQLLAFSRRQMLEPRAIDLNELVGAMCPMIRRLVGENVRVELEMSAESAWVVADPSGLEQVVMNLVVNARDAMPEGGVLAMEIRETAPPPSCSLQSLGPRVGPCIALSVRDTGHGIDEATRARIFEPFFTTKPVGKGTGLGLPTAFGVVQQSGGCIDVESRLGHGSTFTVYLPRHEAAPPSSRRREELQLFPGDETVLLVEDDDQVRSLARKVLARNGYHVLDAQNAGEAILVSEGHAGPIHLLLTDCVMPRMNGRQLAERLAAARPSMKVLYMSGYTDDPVVRAQVAAANAPFLAKPVTPTALAHRVRQVLDAGSVRDPSSARRGGGGGAPR